MKALIIRLSSIGDIVLTTPVIRCLKKQKENITIHYLTKKSFYPVLEANPYIDKFHLLEDDLNEVIAGLKQENFDVVIDLHNNVRSLRVKKALNLPAYSFDKMNLRKWLLVNLKLDVMPPQHIVDRYMATVLPLGVLNDGEGLDYFLPDSVEINNKDLPMSHWAGYVACVIGGSYRTKQLPADQWKKFISDLPYPVMLLGGPEDRKLGEEIATLNPIKIYNSCGKFNLNESAWLVRHARVVVTNDTGLMHIAAAFQKPIISLWGNTSPAFGMYPYLKNRNVLDLDCSPHFLMEKTDLYCHPCSKLGFSSCPQGHFKCMNTLDMKELVNMTNKYWG